MALADARNRREEAMKALRDAVPHTASVLHQAIADGVPISEAAALVGLPEDECEALMRQYPAA